MRTSSYLFVFAWLLIFTVGCQPNKVATREELNSYIQNEENGLYKKHESNGVLIELQVHPKDLIIAQEIDGMNYKPTQVDSIRKKLDEIVYFRLSLSRNGEEVINILAPDEDRFKRGIDYLSSGIGGDMKLIQNNDTTDVQATMYMRGYGISKSSRVLVAFKKNLTRNGPLTILYTDSFFNTGLTKFDFEVRDIKFIPTLIL